MAGKWHGAEGGDMCRNRCSCKPLWSAADSFLSTSKCTKGGWQQWLRGPSCSSQVTASKSGVILGRLHWGLLICWGWTRYLNLQTWGRELLYTWRFIQGVLWMSCYPHLILLIRPQCGFSVMLFRNWITYTKQLLWLENILRCFYTLLSVLTVQSSALSVRLTMHIGWLEQHESGSPQLIGQASLFAALLGLACGSEKGDVRIRCWGGRHKVKVRPWDGWDNRSCS